MGITLTEHHWLEEPREAASSDDHGLQGRSDADPQQKTALRTADVSQSLQHRAHRSDDVVPYGSDCVRGYLQVEERQCVGCRVVESWVLGAGDRGRDGAYAYVTSSSDGTGER